MGSHQAQNARGGLARRALDLFERLVAVSTEDVHEAARQRFLGLSIVAAVPTLVGFAIMDVVWGFRVDAVVEAGCAAVLFVALVVSRRQPDSKRAYRAASASLAILLIHLATFGVGTVPLLWLHTYPPAVLFLLGAREGAIWVGALLIAAFSSAALLPGHFGPTPPGFLAQLGVSLFLVALLCYGLETLRERTHAHLARQNETLRNARSEVKALSGLLPICASCKRIRNDEGYWQRVEDYISNRTAAQFTHGVCPDCAERLYGARVAGTEGGAAPDAGTRGPG